VGSSSREPAKFEQVGGALEHVLPASEARQALSPVLTEEAVALALALVLLALSLLALGLLALSLLSLGLLALSLLTLSLLALVLLAVLVALVLVALILVVLVALVTLVLIILVALVLIVLVALVLLTLLGGLLSKSLRLGTTVRGICVKSLLCNCGGKVFREAYRSPLFAASLTWPPAPTTVNLVQSS
jgi:hypothetical protein